MTRTAKIIDPGTHVRVLSPDDPTLDFEGKFVGVDPPETDEAELEQNGTARVYVIRCGHLGDQRFPVNEYDLTTIKE